MLLFECKPNLGPTSPPGELAVNNNIDYVLEDEKSGGKVNEIHMTTKSMQSSIKLGRLINKSQQKDSQNARGSYKWPTRWSQ